MAAIQPFVNLQPYEGTEKENLNEFIRQLESCIQIAGIANNDRHQYLHLHLKGGALTYFDQLPDAVRQDYDQALATLSEFNCKSWYSKPASSKLLKKARRTS